MFAVVNQDRGVKIMRMIFVVGMAIILGASIGTYSAVAAAPEVGQEAPDFTLKGLDGEEVTLSNLNGTSPVVLLFGSCT